jgi:polysaccharide deacetylase family protein (PEP-CTERM system associated)
VLNALTVDVEDYYHVSAFEPYLDYKDWEYLPSRVENNVMRILEILEDRKVKATFFALGWVADRNPSLIRKIYSEGHEIASHGYSHKLAYEMTHDEFREDVRKSKNAIEDSIGAGINGFRATSFSLIESSLWALDVLIEEGFLYDSSIFPIHHDRYGIPCWQRFPHVIKRSSGFIYELPPSTFRLCKVNLPIAGGAYLRFLPLCIISQGLRRINNIESQPAVVYIHPWEIDHRQPRFKVRRLTEVRHYSRLSAVEDKIKNILSEFKFGRISEVINESPALQPVS